MKRGFGSERGCTLLRPIAMVFALAGGGSVAQKLFDRPVKRPRAGKATRNHRALLAHLGVACLDCHLKGSTHAVGDFRPNHHRHRIGTPTRRGMKASHSLGSESAMKKVADFTEFEQCAACFDGGPATPVRTGERFKENMKNGCRASADGAIKTFPMRGSKDSASNLNDDRFITLYDPFEVFICVLGAKLSWTERPILPPSCGGCHSRAT
jgi:hypothetical protein